MELPSPIMRASHKWARGSWQGRSPGLTSNQIRFRLSGQHRKGLMGKHSRLYKILMNKGTYTAHVGIDVHTYAGGKQMHRRLHNVHRMNNSESVTKTQRGKHRDKEPRLPEGMWVRKCIRTVFLPLSEVSHQLQRLTASLSHTNTRPRAHTQR